VVPPENFPMAVSPRCDILNNFGDGRSGGRSHAGIDILATLGQEVYAMADGTLTVQTFAGAPNATLSGNLWRLTAATGGTYYTYGHLSGFAPGLSKGSVVYKGQLLGFVGDTGNPGPGNYHLHYEIHPGGGNAVDPLPTLLPVPAACKVYG
jgi:murein DD-endopeptidase MepM/ murein hydrolase activator NlpD